MKKSNSLMVITLLLAVSSLSAATHYVSLESTNPTPPYTNWITAATNIQQAVDAAAAGDEVVVTNGVYPGGLRVDTPVALRSTNGPQFTVIDGGGTKQCASLADGASLTGFTLANGVAFGGGGVWCDSTNASITNCVMVGNVGGGQLGGVGGGVYGGTLYNCTLTSNSAGSGNGGGAYGGTLYNCTLTGNSACYSGGADNCTLYNCIVYFNAAPNGANYGNNSTLNYCCTTPFPTNGVGNITLDPQLASASHLSAGSPCRGAGNASYASGTDIDGELWGSPPSIGCDEYHAGAVTGPLAMGIVASSTNVVAGYPVTLTALIEGRTTDSVWALGDGDVDINQPYVTHSWTEPGDHLVALWAFNESHWGGVCATVTIHVVAELVYCVATTSTNPQPPYTSWSTAATNIQEAVDAAALSGASVLVTNGVYAFGGRAGRLFETGTRVAVDRPLTLRSVNGPQLTVINGGGTNRCVSLSDGASLTGFTLTNGTAYGYGGGVRCASTNAFLTNCVIVGNSAQEGWSDYYSSGGGAYGGTLDNCTLTGNSAGSGCGGGGGGACGSTLYNCVLSGNSAWPALGGGASASTLYNCTLSSNSAVDGGGAYRSTLYNCTLTGNSAPGGFWGCRLLSIWGNGSGGGVHSCTLYNCTLTGNSTDGNGGGAERSTLYNCTVSSNWVVLGNWNTGNGSGGGASGCALYNCTLTGNSASGSGGGASADWNFWGNGNPSTLYNCIVCFNTASLGGANYETNSTLNYCCTTPLPAGVGNITSAPLFVDFINGNLRLQSNSPSINAGNNAYVTNSTDLDGNPRIVSGTVDMGAYEFQLGVNGAFIGWLQQYGLPTDGSADFAHADADGLNNWQEWVCGTCPTNEVSALRLLSASPTGTNVTVTWQSVAGVNYVLERSASLATPFTLLATNILGQAVTTTYADTNATGPGPFFYRVGANAQ